MSAAALVSPVDAAGLVPVIHATRLCKRYGTRQVLRDIELQLEPGSVLGLVGRNGAGKSTLIRALLGTLEVDSGSVTVLGEPALALSDDAKAQIGYVPQQSAPLDWMTAGQMLDFVGRFYPRWDAAYVDRTLSRWSIPRDQHLSSLSPGERQRVELIRALAGKPRLLVLDEPAAALDPVARRGLLREITLSALDEGLTVLFSTHILSDLERVASHLAFLHQGRLLLQAPIDDLKERYARLIVRSVPNAPIVGELSRRTLADGSVSLVIERGADGHWSAIAAQPGVRLDTLGIEDLFVEVTE